MSDVQLWTTPYVQLIDTAVIVGVPTYFVGVYFILLRKHLETHGLNRMHPLLWNITNDICGICVGSSLCPYKYPLLKRGIAFFLFLWLFDEVFWSMM